MKERTIDPIIRDNNLSKNALTCSANEVPDASADICLNGLNNVFSSRPMENISEETIKRPFIILRRLNSPSPYHQDNIPAKNI